MEAFVDIERKSTADYKALMEKGTEDIEALKNGLYDLIREDSFFLDSYTTLYSIMQTEEDFLGAEIMLNRAHDKVLQLICKNPGEWPEKISWEDENNRHIIRALLYKALDFWMGGSFDEAKEILSLLYKSNPDKNLGFDFYLLAVQLKMEYEMFMDRYLNEGMINESGQRWFETNIHQLK